MSRFDLSRLHLPRPYAVTAVAAFVPFLLLMGWARIVPPGDWELQLLMSLQAPDSGPLALLVNTLNALGAFLIWVGLVIALAAIALVMRRPTAALLLALSLVSDLVATIVKFIVERGRPEGVVIDILFGRESFAFPSGHVVRATTLVAVIVWLIAPTRIRLPLALVLGVCAGLLMGYSRAALGVHWPTDVLGGLLLGVGWFALTAGLVEARQDDGTPTEVAHESETASGATDSLPQG